MPRLLRVPRFFLSIAPLLAAGGTPGPGPLSRSLVPLPGPWPFMDPCGPFLDHLLGPKKTSKNPTKVKPRFWDFVKKKSISLHGRPTVVAKPADSQEFLYNMVLRRSVWGSLALGIGYLPKGNGGELGPPKLGAPNLQSS